MVAVLAVTLAAGADEGQRGIFALLGGSPKIVSTFWSVQHADPLALTLYVRQFRPNASRPIRRYELEMERAIHLVVVRDDFATFAHLHPTFDQATGTFLQTFTRAPGHRYYVYADTTPAGVGQQVFRFTLERDGVPAAARLPATPSPHTADAGPYTATLQSTAFPADRPLSIDVTVRQDGRPAADLRPYLGAPAHCVIINTATLAYAHVHPALRGQQPSGETMSHGAMAMGNVAGPLMRLHVPPLPAGTYRFWLQFRNEERVFTAPFTVDVR